MSRPESDIDFRARLTRVVSEQDRVALGMVGGHRLDAIARRYDRFRTGVPLRAFDDLREDREPAPSAPLCHDEEYPL